MRLDVRSRAPAGAGALVPRLPAIHIYMCVAVENVAIDALCHPGTDGRPGQAQGRQDLHVLVDENRDCRRGR